MISNQDTEYESTEFLNCMSELAEEFGHEFDPDFIMMNASDSSYNAAIKCFPNYKVLMCYFDLMKNIRKECERPLSAAKYEYLLDDIRSIHMSESPRKNATQLEAFKDIWNKKSTREVYNYLNTWFNGRLSNWRIFHNPPGWTKEYKSGVLDTFSLLI